MMPNPRLPFLLLLSLALAACRQGPTPEDARKAAKANAERMDYEQTIKDWRKERVQRLMKPDGWLSLVGMHWLEYGRTRVGSGPDNGTRLQAGPAHIGVVTLGKDGKLSFVPEAGAGITIDGQPASGSVALSSDADKTRDPTVVGFNKGDASFIVIKRGERYALRVRDALAPTRTGFPGIDYFPIDPAFRLRAHFTPKPPGSKIDIVNILGIVEPMDNPGTLSFAKEGKQFTVETVDEGDHRLFLVFADRTSGHQSYAASRFVYAKYPDARGYTTLDFNEAYNPPCAFTPYSTCPMPPLQNRIDLAVNAGERKPSKPAPMAVVMP
jgi:uncharacterized protein (DUF1684 family)